MSRKRPWYTDPTRLISMGVGLLAICTYVVNSLSADVRQKVKVEAIEADVEELQSSVESQEQQLTETEKQYAIIQQQLGVVVESLKDLKARR